MRRNWFMMLIALFASSSLWAVAEPTAEELEQQRRRLAEVRKHPEQLARLRDNLQAYLHLPEKRREAIARLDRDLHELPAKKQQRAWQTLERYADWLENLREKDPAAYQAIKEAPDAGARLALISERRDRDWMESQPRARREEYAKLAAGAARANFVALLRHEERRKHEQWLVAKRFWRELDSKQVMPCRLSDFSDKSDKVKKYVEEYLLPTLTAAEKKQLADAEGRWPDFPQVLVALASKHPSALPSEPPRKITELPDPVRRKLIETKKGVAAPKLEKEVRSYEGPNFASNIVKHYAAKLPFEYEYLASNYNSLQKPMKEFVADKLMPKLDQAEKRTLADAEKKWPEYPLAIQELAKKHQLTPPWHILPDPERWKWDLYRHSKVQSWGSELAREKDKKTP